MAASNEAKVFNALSYIGPLFLIGLLAKPNGANVRFHANQGLLLFVAELLLAIVLKLVGLVLNLIPVLGPVLMGIIWLVFAVICLLFILYGIRNALADENKELPYFGHLEFIH